MKSRRKHKKKIKIEKKIKNTLNDDEEEREMR
jgi:hypothetical protein